MDHCEECGYSYDAVARDEIASMLIAFGPQYKSVLADHEPDILRAHPFAGMWSVLEYACHLRDVFRVQRERIELALTQEQPTFASMRRDERAVEERYNEQDPALVAGELAEAAVALGGTFGALGQGDWVRTGIYGYPHRAVRTVEWIGRHTIHEGHHHLHDIRRLLAAEES